jgi:hypothetical protein
VSDVDLIRDGETTLAIVFRGEHWRPGLSFLSADSHFVQVGTWGYDRGTRLGPHAHNPVTRQAARTQEVVFVRRGRVRALLFSSGDRQVAELELGAGDLLIALEGGHGYEILEDATQVLEVKNGPYPGPEADRRRFPWPPA